MVLGTVYARSSRAPAAKGEKMKLTRVQAINTLRGKPFNMTAPQAVALLDEAIRDHKGISVSVHHGVIVTYHEGSYILKRGKNGSP